MRRLRLLLLLGLLTLPRVAAAQEGAQPYSLGFETGIRARSTRIPGNDSRTFEEWIGFRLRGAIVDPRLVSFSLLARPRIAQNRFSFQAEPSGSNSRWLELDAGMDLLRSRPLRASLRFTRFSFNDRGFGLYTNDLSTRNSRANAVAEYDNRLMPLRFAFREESSNLQVLDDGGGPGTASVPARLRTLELAGGNRKTTFSLQQDDNRDPGFRRLRLAEFQNQQTWGKGSSLQVQASAASQTGGRASDLHNATLRGLVHLQHLRSVWSDWDVQRLTSRSGALGTTTRQMTGSITWAVRSTLSAGIAGQRTAVDFDAGSQRQFRVGPNAGLTLRLPKGVQASARAAVAYQRYRSTAAPGAQIVVVGERHAFDVGGSLLLDRPDVDLTSIVLRGTDGVLYTLGVDYDVQVTGGYARIVALPGGRLRPSQPVLVDYHHAPIPSLDAPALWVEYSGDLALPHGLRLYHHRWLVDPGAQYRNVPRGSPVRVMEMRTTGAQVVVPAGRLSFNGQAELQYRQDAGFEITTRWASTGVNARLAAAFRAGVGANYLRATGSTGSAEQVGGQAQLDWMPQPTLQISTSAMSWRSLQNAVSRETRIGAGGQVIWQPGLLRAAVYYAYRGWETQEVPGAPIRKLPTHNLVVELTRTF